MSSKLRNLTDQEFSDFKDHVENGSDEQKNNLKKNIHQLDNGDVIISTSRRDFLKQLGMSSLILSGIVLKTEQAHAIFNVLMMKKRSGSSSQIYVDDVFSTYLYTGTGAAQTITNGIALGDSSIWTTENSTALPVGSNLSYLQCDYGAGLFVVVCYQAASPWTTSTIVTSTDGVTWTAGSAGSSRIWFGVARGSSNFAITSQYDGVNNNMAKYSADGLTWTAATGFPATTTFNKTKYVNGVFVATAQGGTTMAKSVDDGVTWTSITVPSGDWYDIAYGGGTYVMCGQTSVGYAYSTNLSSWTVVANGHTRYGIAYGNGIFVSVGAVISTSLDGILWADRLTSAYGSCVDVIYTGSEFIVSCPNGGVYVSADGITWSYRLNDGTGNLRWLAYGGGKLVIGATGANNRYVATTSSTTPSVTGYGGMVWLKNRNDAPANNNHNIVDTIRGISAPIYSNSTGAQLSQNTISSFNSNGFSLGAFGPNASPTNYVSWTFRKAAKFFDIVTYTGSGANRTIAHNLGTTPGMIIVKRTDSVDSWCVYHNGMANTEAIYLEATNAKNNQPTMWNSSTATASVFSLGTHSAVNANAATYVAYLFAHDTTSTGLIQCGSYTGTAAPGVNVTLGFEPQFVIVKGATNTFDWYCMDSMRGMSDSDDAFLAPNTTATESVFGGAALTPTATGFRIDSSGSGLNASGATYIYMAIRRPNKPPTLGTQVFSVADQALNGAGVANSSSGFPVDFLISKQRANAVTAFTTCRLTNNYLQTAATSTEGAYTYGFDRMQGVYAAGWTNAQTVSYAFKRAPEFFDMVNYTGVGTSTTITHGLGVVPELIMVKGRSTGTAWSVWHSALPATNVLVLNSNAAQATDATQWNSTLPTASVFSIGTAPQTNSGSYTFMAHLFATRAGVSKVGSYTGDGTSGKVIACGFSSSARFVMIKRIDSTGDWFIWDATRGTPAGNDPHFSLNATTAEVTTNDSIDTNSSGFIVNQVAATNINVSSATYIFLAIA